MLVNAKIKRLVSFGRYNDDTFIELFQETGIEIDIQKRPSPGISSLD